MPENQTLLKPLAAAYGIDPVQTGIVFLAHLELGYLHPPIGINLFLAVYRPTGNKKERKISARTELLPDSVGNSKVAFYYSAT